MAAIDEHTDDHLTTDQYDSSSEESDSQTSRDQTDWDQTDYTQLQANEDATHESDTTLLKAAASGNDADVRVLLKAGASVDQVDEKGKTPLMHAARNGHVGVIEALLDACANYDAVNLDGDSAAIIATRAGHWEVVVKLFTAGADTRIKNLRGQMAYGVAAPSIQSQFSDLLLGECENADLSRFDVDIMLVNAASRGDVRVVKYLLAEEYSFVDSDIDVWSDQKTPPWPSVRWVSDDPYRPNHGLRDEMRETFYVPVLDTTCALIEAAKHNHLAVVQALLEADAWVDNDNDVRQTALMFAAANGHTAVVETLIRADAEIDCKDFYKRTALMYASWRGQVEVVKKLLAEGADPNLIDEFSENALVIAVENKHVEVVDALLTGGADPNHMYKRQIEVSWHFQGRFYYGKTTALCGAIMRRNVPMVTRLIASGALIHGDRIEAGMDDRINALLFACELKDTAILRLLLEALNKNGETNYAAPVWNRTLKAAANLGPLEAVKVLLTAEVVRFDQEGLRAALHCAAARGDAGITAVLLAAGADASSAIEHALNRNNLEVVEMILDAAAGNDQDSEVANILPPSIVNLLMAHGVAPRCVVSTLRHALGCDRTEWRASTKYLERYVELGVDVLADNDLLCELYNWRDQSSEKLIAK